MSNLAFGDIDDIAKRLSPGVWVTLDEVAIERCFGYGPAAYAAAAAFAKERHCAFIRDGKSIRLSKAYPELGREGR